MILKSAAESSHRICQSFGDDAVNERTARQWFQNFRSGDMALGDAKALDDEALRTAIESDRSQTCVELAAHFQVSDETIGLHLHLIGKAYKLSKRVPFSLFEANKQQRVAACLSLLTRHHNASIFDRVLTSDEKWVQYDTPRRSRHWLSPRGSVPHTARLLHPRKIILCIWCTSRQMVHYELLPVDQTIMAGRYL
ncbi:histone-lysine N-methyltransferase SETMAR-like [Stegodyphus dumicola]|uniref:histone-lysine N-methyltransferase SETMAR-like n=1 Tax=Stegodyphus dumicola TaxID=202533 RepID=UPI0015B21293|nr:histone-lysine N-methyltransferase SETMAR-like [Stegodyphus dumicola]